MKRLFEEFPRFLHSTISFTEARTHYSSLLKLFNSEEGLVLNGDDILSPAYWKKQVVNPTMKSIKFEERIVYDDEDYFVVMEYYKEQEMRDEEESNKFKNNKQDSGIDMDDNLDYYDMEE